ncbi:MAG: metallophosphoesterase [Chloroflexota bacterium]|nr:metallophosphoesterase [Chloroflexota bacterium]
MLSRGPAGETRIFFCADIHGSERCFRKWLNAARSYRCQALIFGGDLAGKILQPIVDLGAGRYQTEMYGQQLVADAPTEVAAITDRIRNAGRYEVIVTPEEKQALDASPELVRETFIKVARASATRWLELADERLREVAIPAFMMLGNDDFVEMQDVFAGSERVTNPEDKVVELPGGYEMISLGYSNPTPWASPRELTEPDLAARLEPMASRLQDPGKSIFNFHVPPRDTHLDQAALLDETFTPIVSAGRVQIAGVGSSSVRSLIERYQPILSLHGHIHESPGMSKIGKTMAINPGSEYMDGILRGAIVTLDPRRGVKGWQLVQG